MLVAVAAAVVVVLSLPPSLFVVAAVVVIGDECGCGPSVMDDLFLQARRALLEKERKRSMFTLYCY